MADVYSHNVPDSSETIGFPQGGCSGPLIHPYALERQLGRYGTQHISVELEASDWEHMQGVSFVRTGRMRSAPWSPWGRTRRCA